MLRFLHAGDFHLDSPFSGLSPKQAAAAREEQRALLDRVQTLALTRKVDLVLLSGDLFDGAHIYPETIEILQAALAAMSVPIFIAPGNHDPHTAQSPYVTKSWPDNVHLFRENGMTAIPLPELGCTVYGSAFTESSRHSSPLEGLELASEGFHLACFHGDLGKRASRYGPISVEELASSGLHYAALGHVHARSELSRLGKTYYAYPGCPQGRGFDETGEKGVYIGQIDESGHVSLEFNSLCMRQYLNITVELRNRPAVTVLKKLLAEVPESTIARIFLRGERCEAQLPLEDLQHLAAPYFYSVAMIDESERARGLWAREEEDSLCGAFLRDLKHQLEAASPEEQALIELAARYGLAALEGREEPR